MLRRISTIYSEGYHPSVIFYEILVFPEQLNTRVYTHINPKYSNEHPHVGSNVLFRRRLHSHPATKTQNPNKCNLGSETLQITYIHLITLTGHSEK